MNNLYYTINDALRQAFDTKVIKLSLDGGFTCPNRDGTCGTGGCIFCSAAGSGDFAADSASSIYDQTQSQIKLLQDKWPNAKYIAYFQNFTNTYASVDKLKKLYDEALQVENVVGLAIATRPDCLSPEVIRLLSEYNQKTFLWVELGLQSIHKKTEEFIRRGYSLETYDKAMRDLGAKNIKAVVHLILNFMDESYKDMEKSLRYVCDSGAWGVKLQMLNVLEKTDLALYYHHNPFYLRTADE